MTTVITRAQLGDILSMRLEKVSSVENLKELTKKIGYNDSPLFGAKKAKIRVMSEFVFANSAVIVAALNDVFPTFDALSIAKNFSDSAQKSMFVHIASQNSDFSKQYKERVGSGLSCGSYVAGLTTAGVVPPIIFAMKFLQNLGIDSENNWETTLSVVDTFRSSYLETAEFLKMVELMPGEIPFLS